MDNYSAYNKDAKVKEIIFFDDLGFGWVVDRKIIMDIHNQQDSQENLIKKTLDELIFG